MKTNDMKHWLSIIMLILALCWAAAAHAGTPQNWKDTGFSINATGMTLRQVINEFSRVYGVRAQIDFRDGAILKGKMKADSGTEFLDRLAQTHRFRWFVYNDTLYIVPPDDNTSLRIQVGEDAVQDAKAALVGLGLFDSRFGWGELPDEGVVIISGPRAYVNLARDILMPDEKSVTSAKSKRIMVFRLKYASATDRVITVRGKSETIPGIKTILSGLLLGPESNEKLADIDQSSFDMGSHKRSRQGKNGRGSMREVGNSYGAKARAQEDDDSDDRSKSRKSRDDRPRIEADPSLNAIMIFDYAHKRDIYKDLIAELDIEPQQIEIEALIVDIDRRKLGEMGVEWGVRKHDTITRVNGSGQDSRGVELPLPGSTLLISNAARFYARLKAMEENGQARVLAKPTVLTLDNVAAVLDLSQTSYVPLVGERVADLADITAGTKLRVVPRIVKEGGGTRVRLEIDVEDGTLGGPGTQTNVTRSTISTQAIIDMQQTLMIGGYHVESVSKQKQQVPVLGDVPLLGGLFRSTEDSESTRERLFLITPRLSGTAGTPAPSRSKANASAQKIAELDSGNVDPVDPATFAKKPNPLEVAAQNSTPVKPAKRKCARPKGAGILSMGALGWNVPIAAAIRQSPARPRPA